MSAPTGSARQTFAYAALLIHPTENCVLVLPSANSWGLPRWTLDDGTWPFWQTVDGVNRALDDSFGIATTTLRCLKSTYDSQKTVIENTYAVELREADRALPAGHRWLGPGELDAATFAHPDDRALLTDWFAGRLGDLGGPPWFRPGWAAEAPDWIAMRVAQLGRTMDAPVEQMRSWERGSTWRIRTDAGTLYFKAVPPVFAHEVALPPMLNAWRPGCATEVLARDEARGWMLMANLGDRDLSGVRDIATWEAAMRSYAELQIACIARRDELLAIGCPRHPLANLPAGLDALLADETAFLPGQEGGLTAVQIASLRTLAPELKAACAELAELGLPETLDHGDLWGGNIFLADDHGDGFRFHDWSDSAVTHPFFGPPLILIDSGIDAPDARDRLRDAYLTPWEAVAPTDRLLRAYALAQQLAPLEYALLYHRRILPAMRAKREMERMLPYYVRMLVGSTNDEVRSTN
jgi:hypothetical protein